MTSVAINGASGRMGQRLVALCMADERLLLVAAIERDGHADQGKDAGLVACGLPAGVGISGDVGSGVQVLIDFTVPAGMRRALDTCLTLGCAMVVGTTGLTEEDHRAIDDAAERIAVLQAPNMSLGVNLLLELVGQAAGRLGEDYDIEIVDTHHRFKKDAPSGTALALAGAACEARDKDPKRDVVHGLYGEDPSDAPRRRGQIGIHALRMGDVVGEHTVRFGTLGERLELGHIATSRDIFARGALEAANWIVGKPAGRYSMRDVLGF